LSRTREKALNDAIASADPGAGFEPFACAYVEFYRSDAQVKIENRELQGQQKVFSALMSLLTLSDLEFGSALKRLQLQVEKSWATVWGTILSEQGLRPENEHFGQHELLIPNNRTCDGFLFEPLYLLGCTIVARTLPNQPALHRNRASNPVVSC